MFKSFLEKLWYVAVVQGSAFGLEGFFRISYATSMENLKKAMEENKRFLRKFKLNENFTTDLAFSLIQSFAPLNLSPKILLHR